MTQPTLDDVCLDPADLEALSRDRNEARQRQQQQREKRVQRLQQLPGEFVRVPLQWLTNPCREHVLGPEPRLFLLVLYRSHWGQRGIKLTDAVTAEVGVTGSTKRAALGRLVRKGWVRVERHTGHEAPVVWPIVLAE